MSPEDSAAETREPRWWVETTRVKGYPHRQSGSFAVGRALLSPRCDEAGRDIYSNMRQVREGDICLHLADRAFTGISRIAGVYEEFKPSQAGLDPKQVRIPSDEGYRVGLRGYRRLDPALDHSAIVGREFRERLLSIHKTDRVYYDRNLQLKQQGYLNPAPPELVDVLDEAYRKVSGKTLREIVKDDDAQPPSPRWDTFIEWARRFYEWEHFDEQERDYKLEIAANVRAAKEALLGDGTDWGDKLRAAFGPPNNLTSWRVHAIFLDLLNADREGLEETLRRLWETEADATLKERVRGFAGRVREIGVQQELDEEHRQTFGNGRATLASFLLMADDAKKFPIYRARPFNTAYKLTGYPPPESGAEIWELYERALSFIDEFIHRAAARGLRIEDRLDAQSLIWCVTKTTLNDKWPEGWPKEDKNGLAAYRKDGVTLPPGPETLPLVPDPSPVPKNPWTADKVAELAEELLWQPGDLQKIIDGLRDKRQVIFQGPPGTGKTYVAKRIAEWCRDHGGGFDLVQFHPSYAYEDFIEGFRPRLSDSGQAGFALTEGPLRRIAERARNKPDATFILVIDEINRGNLAKVLGELYFLLEYRDEKVALQYSNERFSLPENLWFIGTMNTTDRSIALVDAALRRRFYFFNFFPDQPPIRGLLEQWIAKNSPGMEWVVKLVDKANEKLEDRHLGIGPSHFMKKEPPLDEDRVRFIWEQAIIPHIEEQYFGDETKLKGFAFGRLKGELDGAPGEPVAASSEPEGPTGDENEQSEQADE